MKRALLGTVWIGAIAAGTAIALQLSYALNRPNRVIAEGLGLAAGASASFANLLFVAILSFAVAWTMLQVDDARRRAGIFFLLVSELIGAAWVLRLFSISFVPLPAIIATVIATGCAIAIDATSSGRQRRAVGRLFRGRLAPVLHDRLTQREAFDFSQPVSRDATFVFCKIANEADLIDELTTGDCAQLTRDFIEFASSHFLSQGGYLHAADGEGIRVFFGFPEKSDCHALDASRAALSFRKSFSEIARSKPDSLGKIDVRMGVSSGVIVATLRQSGSGAEIVVAGETLAMGRRLADANQTYGSQILLDPHTFSAAGREILARPMDFLRSTTDSEERLEVYELLALTAEATPEQVAQRDRFWRAVVYFREQCWNQAQAEFLRVQNDSGTADRPLQWYLHRLEPLCRNMPDDSAAAVERLVPLP